MGCLDFKQFVVASFWSFFLGLRGIDGANTIASLWLLAMDFSGWRLARGEGFIGDDLIKDKIISLVATCEIF